MRYEIFARYGILLLVAFPNLFLLYFIFTPLTIFPSYAIINFVIPSSLEGNRIITQAGIIELIEACIAGSAYYLLLILNLTTPNIHLKKRIFAILFSFIAFLAVNIFRIFLFSMLFFSGFRYFDTTHLLTWYTASTLLVIGIWIAEINFFKIKEIPLYSDVRDIIKEIHRKHMSKTLG